MQLIAGDPIGAIMSLALFALVATVPVSLVVLWRYRAAVLRAMGAEARGDLEAPRLGAPGAPPPALRVERTAGLPEADPGDLYRRAVRRPWRIAAAYALAGLVHAVAAAVLVFVANGYEVLPHRVLVVTLVLAWPVSLTVAAVGIAGRRWKAAAVVGYLAVLGGVAGPRALDAASLLGIYALVPALALLLMAWPGVRSAGPFMAVVLLGAATGALFSLEVMLWVLASGAFSTADARLTGLGVVLLGAVVGGLALRAIARSYERRRWSDQMLQVAAWWLLYTLWQTLFLMIPVGWWGLAGLLPFGLFLVALRLALWPVRDEAERTEAVPLLVLRVFGARRRSERLFREIGLTWRTVGGIGLISAPDLAGDTLEPHELLTFLAGRLRRLFVRTRADLDRQVADLAAGPDPDGRYRVTELKCHDDTWRAAVARLVAETEAVLVDLRGFQARNRGIQYELRLLLSTVPARRLVLVTDATSDDAALEATLAAAWAEMAADAPNRLDPEPVRIHDLGRQGRQDVRGLLARLAEAAGEAVPVPA